MSQMYFNFSSDQQRHFVFLILVLHGCGGEFISRKNTVTLSLRDKAISSKFFCVLYLIGSYLALPTQIMKANKQRKTPAYFSSNCALFHLGPQGPDLVNSCAPCVPRTSRNLCHGSAEHTFPPIID